MINKNLIPWKRKNEALAGGQDVISPLETFHRQMNDLFEDLFENFNISSQPALWRKSEHLETLNPHFDVAETNKSIKVTAELPGMDEKDIEVTLENNILTVKGEKKEESEENKKDYFVCERKYGHFQRALLLPSGIEEDNIKAQFKKGVLTVTLPKTADAQKRGKQIEIISE